MKDHKEIKKSLYAKCQEFVEKRIDTIQKSMEAAQDAANMESKSSAGDKYETTRSMMQLDRELSAGQLVEALKLKRELDQVDPEKDFVTVQPGSLVLTNQGNFFISISAGKIILDGTEYFAVSLASPIGTQLKNLKAGDDLLFNNKKFQIKEVH